MSNLYFTCKLSIKSDDFNRDEVLKYAEVAQSKDFSTVEQLKEYLKPINEDLRKEARKDDDFKDYDKEDMRLLCSRIVEHNRRLCLAGIYLAKHTEADGFRDLFDKLGFFKLWMTQAEVYKPKKAKPADSKPADSEQPTASQPADSEQPTADSEQPTADSKPADSEQPTADSKPADSKPADSKPADSKPADSEQPTASQPADSAWCQACEAVDKIASLKLTKEERIGIVAELMDALNVNVRQIKASEQPA